MPWDMISWGSRWLDGERREHMVTSIDYERGGLIMFSADDVTPAKSLHKAMIDGIEIEVNCRDFIIPIAYFDDNYVVPSAGDMIVTVINDRSVRHRVTAYPNSEEVYRPHDRYRLAYRVHTLVDEIYS